MKDNIHESVATSGIVNTYIMNFLLVSKCSAVTSDLQKGKKVDTMM